MNDKKYKYIKIYFDKGDFRHSCAVIELDFENQESMDEMLDIFKDSYYDYSIDTETYQVKFRIKGSTGYWAIANDGDLICKEDEYSIFITNRVNLRDNYVDSKYADNTADKCLLLEFFRYLEKRGFIDESLQYDTEHQVDTFLELKKQYHCGN